MKAFVVPIFIPNVGCPGKCVFCEQSRITSQPYGLPSSDDIRRILSQALSSERYRKEMGAQVAFYGGTFTRLPLEKMKKLLKAVKPFLEDGYFSSIRVSTRPDSLQSDRLELMKEYGVQMVELGAQSMDDRVLKASKRGHTHEDTVQGVFKLKSKGFSVGIQLMPGLPMETERSFTETVMRVMELKPDIVRLYPTVVIEGTELAEMYRAGRYTPLGLEDAVRLCAEAAMRFEKHGIRVIRIGLMSSPSLLRQGQIVAGPWHPCFGMLVRSRMYHLEVLKRIPPGVRGKKISIGVNPRDASLLRGYRNTGLRYMEEVLGAKIADIEANPALGPSEIRVNII